MARTKQTARRSTGGDIATKRISKAKSLNRHSKKFNTKKNKKNTATEVAHIRHFRRLQHNEVSDNILQQAAFEWILPHWYDHDGPEGVEGEDIALYKGSDFVPGASPAVPFNTREGYEKCMQYLISIGVLNRTDDEGVYTWGDDDSVVQMLVKHMQDSRLRKFCFDHLREAISEGVMGEKGWDDNDIEVIEVDSEDSSEDFSEDDSSDEDEEMLEVLTKSYVESDVLEARRAFQRHIQNIRNAPNMEYDGESYIYRVCTLSRHASFVQDMVLHPNMSNGFTLLMANIPSPTEKQKRHLRWRQQPTGGRKFGGMGEVIACLSHHFVKHFFKAFTTTNKIDTTMPVVVVKRYDGPTVGFLDRKDYVISYIQMRCMLKDGTSQTISFLDVATMKRKVMAKILAKKKKGDDGFVEKKIYDVLVELPTVFMPYTHEMDPRLGETPKVVKKDWDNHFFLQSRPNAPVPEKEKKRTLNQDKQRLNNAKDLLSRHHIKNYASEKCREMIKDEIKRLTEKLQRDESLMSLETQETKMKKIKKLERELSNSRMLLDSHERRAAQGIGSRLPEHCFDMIRADILRLQKELEKATADAGL